MPILVLNQILNLIPGIATYVLHKTTIQNSVKSNVFFFSYKEKRSKILWILIVCCLS